MRAGTSMSVLVVLAAALSVACVLPDQFSQLQKDVADVRHQLQRIEAEQAANRARLDELNQASGQPDAVTRADLEDIGFRMDRATRDAAEANQRLRELSQRVERLSQEVDRRSSMSPARPSREPLPGFDSVPPAAGGPTPSAGSAEELYNTAYADFSKGNYDLAVAGFEEFYDTYPDHPSADNALYWIGECYFSQGRYPEAVRAFDRLLEAYPDSDKAASGDLKKGLAYLEQNEVGKAIVQLQHVHDAHRGTDEARVARDRLTALGIRI